MGRVLARSLPRPLPVGDSLCDQTCGSVVLGQQFGLGLYGLGKTFLQHLGNFRVILS